MINFTAHKDVACVYPMSGQYGRAPRALYYSLLLFVVVFRRQNWLTAGAAAFCLTFGGSAAIHALILAPILSLGRAPVPNGMVQLPNSTHIEIAPLASDLDSDATLAIVGTGFLIIIPMALWSAHFRHSGAVPILVIWTILMFIGMICSMTILYATNSTASGPLLQHRFCSPGYNDSLPYSGNPTPLFKNSWNDTVWTYFQNANPSFPSCVYPCLSTTELLRQPGDLRVIQFLDIHSPNPLYWMMIIPTAIIWGCIPFTMFFSAVILVLRINTRTSEVEFELPQKSNWRIRLARFTTWAVNVYGKALLSFMFVVFWAWAEWIIAYDLQSESMQLVGQWSPLVGAALVLISAVVGKYWPQLSRRWWKSPLRSTWSQEGTAFLQGSD